MFARFSTVAGEVGSADTKRDPRGFALKFYTEEGNWDMVGNNTPIFFVRDAMKFPDFIHSQKRDPRTHLHDPNAVWDFFSLVPESVHQVTILYSERGTPDGFRHMNGYGSHTFKFVNRFVAASQCLPIDTGQERGMCCHTRVSRGAPVVYPREGGFYRVVLCFQFMLRSLFVRAASRGLLLCMRLCVCRCARCHVTVSIAR